MAVEDAPSYADPEREVARLRRELAEARDELTRSRERAAAAARALDQAREDEAEGAAREAATREILRVIAGSPADLQHVLDSLVATASRLCEAPSACLLQYDGDALRVVAACGVLGEWMRSDEASEVAQRGIAANPESISGRAMFERRTVHVPEVAVAGREFPDTARDQVRLGHRAQVSTPLLRKGEPIGILAVQRFEPGPFTEAQIKLLETFADQAVIAIENTRLFQELQERNRDLSEALERQTATSAILRVIASSPTDVQPVLEAVAESAARLFEAWLVNVFRIEDGVLRIVAARGSDAPRARGVAVPFDPGHVTGRAILERRTIHIPDMRALPEGEYPISRELSGQFGWRTIVTAPFLAKGAPVGAISLNRQEVRPFTDREIELVQSFADQAAIAIENARLFQELQARVEELQALGEVGQAVNSSLELQAVLSTVVSHADQLSGTDGGVLYEYDEATREFALRASRQLEPGVVETLRATRVRLGEGAVGQAALAREALQIPDITAEGAYRGRLLEAMIRAGHRAVLAVPLLREDRILGGLVVVRKTPGEFPSSVVELVKTFASQSALAIQNARLYRELEGKSAQLEQVSRHKSEFLANMSHELRTPLNAIIGFSEVLLERLFGAINEKQEEYLRDVLTSGQHLLSLINDILDLSKVEAGRMELELNTFSLREALENGLTMLKERAGRHGIALGLEIEPGLDLVEADERKVKQVVFNLLSNAVKFTPDGGRVEVSAREVDGQMEIAVRDTGIGIAAADLPHVFDEFRQVGRGEAKHEGTGLGLALAKKFVELHGGTIRAESEPGAGSTFNFTLPRPAAVRETEGQR